MSLEDLEKLLGIVISPSQRDMYQARLSAAISHVNNECGGRFTVIDSEGNVTVVLPDAVKLGVALLVRGMTQSGVASYSIAGMTRSFQHTDGYESAALYWRAYATGGGSSWSFV